MYEYIIRRDLKPTIESLKGKPLEERQKVVGSLLEGALLLPPDEISTELRNELIKTAFEQVDWEPEPIPPDAMRVSTLRQRPGLLSGTGRLGYSPDLLPQVPSLRDFARAR